MPSSTLRWWLFIALLLVFPLVASSQTALGGEKAKFRTHPHIDGWNVTHRQNVFVIDMICSVPENLN